VLKLVSGGELDYEFASVPKGVFFASKNAQGEQKRHLWKRKPVTQCEDFSTVIQKSGFIEMLYVPNSSVRGLISFLASLSYPVNNTVFF